MDGFKPYQANVLIVDDQDHNVSLLERILQRAGFEHVRSTMNPFHIEAMFDEQAPDIILLDLHMPGMDGLQALELIREKSGIDRFLPVLMLTADMMPATRREVLEAGVNDYLTKPFDRTEVVLRMKNLLKTRYLHNQLLHHNQILEERVRQRTELLQQAQEEVLLVLGRASEYRDDITGMHTQRVGHLSAMIAEQMALPERQIYLIRMAAPLHDIGKIGIPDNILLKKGRFEPEEFAKMKKHTQIGSKILQSSSFDVLRTARMIAKWHHEKWDGTGYPDQLSGHHIPIEARIVALADFFDALTNERPYKHAWTVAEAVAEIERERGRHFDPLVVDAFLQIVDQLPHQEFMDASV